MLVILFNIVNINKIFKIEFQQFRLDITLWKNCTHTQYLYNAEPKVGNLYH